MLLLSTVPLDLTPLTLTPFLYAADAKLMRRKVDIARGPESEQ